MQRDAVYVVAGAVDGVKYPRQRGGGELGRADGRQTVTCCGVTGLLFAEEGRAGGCGR